MRPALPALFGCAPLGRGTASVEALTSFLARLCRRRSVRVTDVVDGVLRPCAPRGSFPTRSSMGSLLHSSAASFDSLGSPASTMVTAMEGATMRSDLRAHTLLPLATVFDEIVNLPPVVRYRRWCPGCFADAERAGLPLYEPLLWRVRGVTHCPVHRSPLVERCSRCGASQGAIAMRVPIGFCRVCGHHLHASGDLGATDISALLDDERWMCARAAAVGRMLVAAQHAIPSRDGFPHLIADAAARPGTAGLTQRQLGLWLGVGWQSFSPWCDALAFPPLHHYVGICLQLGADPAEVMTSGFVPEHRSWPPSGDEFLADVGDPWAFALRVREREFERKHPQSAAELDRLVAAPLATSLDVVEKALGTTSTQLSISSPLRWARLYEARSAHLSARRDDARERARVALEKAIAAGGTVAGYTVGRWARVSESDLASYCPDLYAQLCALVDARVASRDPEFVRRAEAVLEAALRTPRGLAAAEVARSIGSTPSILKCACRKLYRRLIDLRCEERRALRAAIRAGLEAEVARPTPRSTVALARAFGATLSDLQRAGPPYLRYIEKRRGLAAARAREAQRKKARRAADERARRHRIDQISAAFRVELADSSPRSPRAVLLELGVDSSFAQRHCGGLYCLLRDAHAACPSVPTPLQAQRARDAERRQRAAARARRERVAKVEAALRAELRKPTPRSPRAVLAAIGVSDFVASADCTDLYGQLRAAYASGGAERRVRIERLDAALRAEAGRATPRSPHAIIQQLAENDAFARKHCREALSLLASVRVVRRNERVAAVETAFRTELRRASPRAPHTVLKAIGVPPWDAKRYCRDAYDLLRDAHAARPRAPTEYQCNTQRKREQRKAAAA